MKHILLFFITGYQKLFSPLLKRNTCAFYPTCSHYAKEAIEKHGAAKGSLMAVKRIGRCHPWQHDHIDPVQ
ncbi:membrane protein insertion efficiency factor YidD [Candidatus Wolfebacteria bacterium]|nr:MAG: membrane protein insertion efficiency factor YidD [Candidatus Wolfebacteria bacterium]